MPLMVLGLSGSIGAGKATAATYIARRCAASVFRISDVIHETLERQGVPLTRENFARTSQVLRRSHGENYLAKRTIKRIRFDSAELAVIDGVRLLSDQETFLCTFANYHLIHIHTGFDDRFGRIRNRRQRPEERDMSLEVFMALSRMEPERYQETLSQMADFVIYNDRTWTHMFRELDGIMQGLTQTTQ